MATLLDYIGWEELDHILYLWLYVPLTIGWKILSALLSTHAVDKGFRMFDRASKPQCLACIRSLDEGEVGAMAAGCKCTHLIALPNPMDQPERTSSSEVVQLLVGSADPDYLDFV